MTESRESRTIRYATSAARALKRIEFIADRIADIRASPIRRGWGTLDYERWAFMYAKRRANALQNLARATKIQTRQEAIADLVWLIEHVPAVGLAAYWAVEKEEVERWVRTGPPIWRYSTIQAVRKRIGELVRRGENVTLLQLFASVKQATP